MQRTSGRSRWLVVPIIGCLALLGCGGSAGPGGKVDVTDEPTETPFDVCDDPTPGPDETDDFDDIDDECSGTGGAGGDDESFDPPVQGEWTGTLTYTWSQKVEETGPGMHSVQEQTYHATVQVTSTQVDIRAWELSGQAFVTASWMSDFQSQMDTPLGPCNQHYTDLVPRNEPRAVDVVSGGLEVGDIGELYQFHVNLWGFELTNHTVRDDTGCFGGNYVEDTPWPVAPTTLGNSGTVTDRTVLSGTYTKPNTQGDDTLTWDLRLD